MFAENSGAGGRDHGVLRRAVFAGALLGSLAGCSPPHPEVTFKVKLDFRFKSPAEDKSFSGVWEVWETRFSNFPNPGSGLQETLIGEAIAMPFDNGRVAFALLVDHGGGSIRDPVGMFSWSAASALYSAYDGRGPRLSEFAAVTPTTPVTLPAKALPALITFDNLADPSSGRLIEPAELSVIAGPGWTFDRAEIQLVNDPPTQGASLFLPWVETPSRDSGEPSWTNFRQHPEYFVRKAPSW